MSAETRTSVGVAHPTRYSIIADHELREDAEAVGDEVLSHIVQAIVDHPRSQQVEIGPSEMAVDCEHAILHKLNGDPEPERGQVPWKPTLGTAFHAWAEDVFEAPTLPGNEIAEQRRWHVERTVGVGTVGGVEITGHCDLYDAWSGTVLDWKLVGKSTHKKYRAHGPSAQYRGQAHLYGRGYERLGYNVRMVAICFLPREGEFTDTVLWTEPYNPELAAEIVAKCDALANLLATVGITKALTFFDPCDDRWCDWCGAGSSLYPRPQMPTTTRGLLSQ